MVGVGTRCLLAAALCLGPGTFVAIVSLGTAPAGGAAGPYPSLGACAGLPGSRPPRPLPHRPIPPHRGGLEPGHLEGAPRPRTRRQDHPPTSTPTAPTTIHPDFGSPARSTASPTRSSARASQAAPDPLHRLRLRKQLPARSRSPAGSPVEGGRPLPGRPPRPRRRPRQLQDSTSSTDAHLRRPATEDRTGTPIRRGRMGPPLGRPAPRRLDLRRRRRPADLPRPRPL